MNFNQIKNLVINSKVLGYGAYGYVLQKGDYAYKIDRILYDQFKSSEIDEDKLMLKLLLKKYVVPDIELIKYYDSIRNKVKYTKLPSGIIYFEELPLLLQMPYHKNYVNISDAIIEDSQIFDILYNLSRAFYELIKNRVYQTDLCLGKNVMVNEKTNDVQLIDLDGEYLYYINRFNQREKEKDIKKEAYFQFFEFAYELLKDFDVNVDYKYFREYNSDAIKKMLVHSANVLSREGKLKN